MDIAERFSANLLRCRKRAGMSQEEVAAFSSLHRTEIGKLEQGDRLPRLDTVVKLAGALHVDPCELLAGMIWQPSITQPGRFEASA